MEARKMNKKRIIGLVMLLILPVVTLLAGCDVLNGTTNEDPPPLATEAVSNETRVIVEGRIVPREESELFFQSGGELDEVLVSEGQKVSRGQVLARLGDRESYQASLAAAKLELALAQQAVDDLVRTSSLAYQQARTEWLLAELAEADARQRLEELDTDDTQRKIDDANVTLSNREDELEDAQDEFDKYANLDPDNTERKNAEDRLEDAQTAYDRAERERDRLVNELEQARTEAELSNARLIEAQFTLDQRTDGPDQIQMAAAQARLDNAKAQLTAAEAALDHLNLVAPYDGTIVKVSIAVGETAMPNRAVMVIADFSVWYVETTDLTENEVVSIAIGQKALIVPDALPELEMEAQVESISEGYLEIAGDITYETRLILTDPDPQIRWGMTVEVIFGEK
jgi:HlyD family secretion protein